MSVLKEKQLRNYIKKHRLQHREDVINFVERNPENLALIELSRISELVNNSRSDTAAYYTEQDSLKIISHSLPKIDKSIIRILEPSVGVGNFLQTIIDNYSHADKLIIDVVDIDPKSIDLVKVLNNYRNIPENVKIHYYNEDFLNPTFCNHSYDLIIGNPPFLKLSKKTGLSLYSDLFNDNITKNLAGFFIQKAISIAENIVMIQPKYFLSNPDFSRTRELVNQFAIEKIIDLGEKGFKGVLIETIAIFINTKKERATTLNYSVTKDIYNRLPQDELTTNRFPYWLLYRNEFFNDIAKQMGFSVFKVFRDRQLTNSNLKSCGDIQVLKSRNILRDGTGIININDYDKYIDIKDINSYSVGKYLNRTDVFLCPNMTYYPRVIKKPPNVIANGSVAILEKITDTEITNDHLKFINSSTFEEFYRIARNYSTRRLNIDSNTVFFFGLYNG